MNVITWDNREDGTVWISTDGATYTLPTLTGDAAAKFDLHVMPWEQQVKEVLADHALEVPVAWCMGVIRSESDGDQYAQSKDGGVGLMQLTSVKHGHSDDELKQDPKLNIYFGALLLSQDRQGGIDLPATASMYNAGSPCIFEGKYVPCSSRAGEMRSHRPWTNEAWLANARRPMFLTRWGFCSSPGYIDSVVAASNYYLSFASSNA